MPVQADAKIIRISEPRAGVFDFRVLCPEIARQCAPGQFLHVKCGEENILRRPISVCDASGDELRFVFEVRGRGTRWLSLRREGEALDILGPLGNGFELGDTSRKAVFVGGGIGIFPLLMAAKPFGRNATVLLGFKTLSEVIFERDFAENGADVRISTDDGSCGACGLVTALLEQRMNEGPCGVVFACGPRPMLKCVAAAALARGIECQVSMEERMGCGVGACLVCACKTREGGREAYSHVCKDGPVYRAERVVFDD